MANRRKVTSLARQLFKLSFDNDQLSPERITGVLAWVEKHRPPEASSVLRTYKHFVEAEISRNRAVIEFAGDVAPEVFQQIAAAMSKRYSRTISTHPVPRPDLIAGVRVRVGCDIFENSVVSQLAALNSAS